MKAVIIKAKDCQDCREAESNLVEAFKDANMELDLEFKPYDSEEGLDLCLEHDIDDIPAIIIEDKVALVGKEKCSHSNILEVLKDFYNGAIR